MSHNISSYVLAIKPYFTKFIVVGAIGVVVNEGLLALLTELFQVKVEYAGLIAIESSIINNFFLNNFWTWRERRKKPFYIRFVSYHSVTILSGGVNYIILVGLTIAGLNHLISNLIGIGAGMVINFLLNHHWTFR